MTDTLQHIEGMHLKIWISKINEKIFLFSKEALRQMEKLAKTSNMDDATQNS